MIKTLLNFIRKWNVDGINFPTTRDPFTGKGSITAFLVYVSMTCVVVSLVFPKIVNASGAFDFFVASISVYVGRRSKWIGSVEKEPLKEEPPKES